METKKQNSAEKHYEFVLPQGFVLQGGKRDYVVERVLGKGGFGVTYKVTGHIDVDNIDFDAPFAVKEYFPDICSREADNATIKVPETKQSEVANGLKDFVNEARRLQDTCNLNHNIVNVNEVFEANGTAYYVLEYLGGGDLRMKVKESPNKALTEQQMLQLMLPVGKAVQCLHENHILHLDIKPDNIVMRKGRKGAADEPVLIDFGLATHFNNSGNPTSMTPSQGISTGYSPIEQYSLLRQFDPRLDVYAFSATCLYLLTGHDPAEALSMPAFFDDSIIPANVSDTVRQAIKHGMSKEKDYRTPSMKQLLAELKGEKGEQTVPINVEPTPIVDENKTVEIRYPSAAEQKKKEEKTIAQRPVMNQHQEHEGAEREEEKSSTVVYVILGVIVALTLFLVGLRLCVGNGGADASRGEPYPSETAEEYYLNQEKYQEEQSAATQQTAAENTAPEQTEQAANDIVY